MTYIQKFPKPGLRRRKPNRPTGPAEATIQAQVELYLRLKQVPFIRLPDALMRGIFASYHIPVHQKKIIAEYLRGLPDVMVLKPDGRYCKMLPLELKTEVGKLTQSQKHWQTKINTIVVRNVKDACAEIDNFLSL